MIEIKKNYFHLTTKDTSYVFSYDECGLLLHNYYGKKCRFFSFDNIRQKLNGGMGTAILYENNNDKYMDNLDLEFSFIGCGDYRETSITLENEQLGFTNNFKYIGYEIIDDIKEKPLPCSYGENDILRIDLLDEVFGIKLELYYKVFEESNTITRFVRLVNLSNRSFKLTRLLSMQLDLNTDDYIMMTFDGAWAKERHLHQKDINQGILINDSKMGVSSNRHNSSFIIKKRNTSENLGESYGFNLVYSGNHIEIVENTITNKIRVLNGINPHCFKIDIFPKDTFITPEATLTYSSNGLNDLSNNMHIFVNNHIVRGMYKNKPRPILINNWEATYFRFNEKKILDIAKKAKELGIELLVLDDGWFGKRDNDHCSLGDYDVNLKKLPNGLMGLSKKINKIGLDFGLWVEPEMVNEDSALYRKHPEYAVKVPGRRPSLGRNQLLLDLTNKEVRDYIIENLTKTFNSCNLKYVKWDFNRPITDMYGSTLTNQGEFFYKYIQGLYIILEEINKRFPHILFEGCASGGNRFDLGMLCYFPQIWTSDNTDYLERITIQHGTSYCYPQSTISNHVSAIPNHQVLRNTPLESRFNLASFGVLGYELDLTEISKEEQQVIKKQIKLYKDYRNVLQFGRFYRSDELIKQNDNTYFYVIDKDKKNGVIGFFQNQIHPSMKEDILIIDGLNKDDKYYFRNIIQKNNLKKFGGLINLVLPIRLKLDGKIHNIICKLYKPSSELEYYVIYGEDLFNSGIRLHQQFMGTGFNDKVRVLGDYGSRLYIVSLNKPKNFYKLLKKNISI